MDCTIQDTDVHCSEAEYRPDIHGIIIPGKRGRLLSILYTAAGADPHPTVLLLHGIPGCEQNSDLAQVLRRAGFHVMIFHYSGNWGSDGTYSLAHNLEDANTALDFLLADETFHIDKERIFAVGHSLGGFVCGQLTARRPEIKGAVLLMPCDIGRVPQIAAEDEGAYYLIKNVLEDSAKWLSGTSGEALIWEAVTCSSEYRLESAAAQLAQKPLLCVAGTLDSCTPPAYHCDPLEHAILDAGGVKLCSLRYPTDHFFADYRLSIAHKVTEFLKELCL